MHRLALCAALGCGIAAPSAALAHAIAGARIFPVTLTLDDPGVADELTLPQVTWQRSGADGGPGPVHETDLGVEYDKRITTDLGLSINDGLDVQDTRHDKTRIGGETIEVTGKYQVLVDAPHELIFSVGVIRGFGRTGTLHTGADQYGSTSPTAYVGKGLGDLPIDALRPFAITGEVGYTVADRGLKQVYAPALGGLSGPGIGMAPAQFNLGANNTVSGGLSLQYSVPYLVSQVRDVRMPAFFRHLVPLVELTWSSPTSSPSAQGTQFLVAPGVIWIDRAYQVGLEALVPGNRASGSNVGVVAQFHVFLDDLLPRSLGKPIADW